MRFFFTACLVLLGAAITLAAGLSGRWSGEMPGGGATVPVSFEFAVDGGKLSGTIETRQGKRPIENGKVDAGRITFNVAQRKYEGELAGEHINFTRTGDRGRARSFRVTRAKPE